MRVKEESKHAKKPESKPAKKAKSKPAKKAKSKPAKKTQDGFSKNAIARFKEASTGGKILRVIGGLFVLGVAVVLLSVIITAISVGKINEESLYANIDRSSILYDVNGNEIDTLHYTEDRTVVPIDEMPEDLKNAFIAIEDKTFYKHHGFNWRRMGGAVLSKLTGRASSISGTSTITQQLARNAYLSEIKSQRSIHRKLSEMFIAWRLEKKLSKDEILEAYLNTIYLGYGNYGVSSAARTYFSKEVSDLTLAECAALAALPQAPDSYALITEDPEGNQEIKNINYYSLDEVKTSEEDEEESYTGSEEDEDEEEEGTGFYANDLSKDRRDMVLDLMAEQGYISTADAGEANVDIIDIEGVKSSDASNYIAARVGEIIANIKQQIEYAGMNDDDIRTVVLIGGTVAMPGLPQKVEEILKIKVRLGQYPQTLNITNHAINKPEYIQVFSLLARGADMMPRGETCVERHSYESPMVPPQAPEAPVVPPQPEPSKPHKRSFIEKLRDKAKEFFTEDEETDE